MKIYTKTGDFGSTGLIGGTRVKKFDSRLESYGTVDELNSHIGLMRSFDEISTHDRLFLIEIQNKLFTVGGILATDFSKVDITKKIVCSKEDIEVLEIEIDNIQNELPELTSFILPGGHPLVGHCHVARAVCRRAERQTLLVAEEVEFPQEILIYLNRLSDYLFALSRKIGRDLDVDEVPWLP